MFLEKYTSSLQVLQSTHKFLLLKMNTFKTVVMICAMLSASCSGGYMSHQNQGNPGLVGMMSGSPATSYASQQSSSPVIEQQRPSSSPALEQPQSSPLASAPLLGGGVSAPAATHQICSCITINPAAAAAAPVQQSAPAPATDSFAPAQQTFSAPQQSFAAAPQQQMQNSFIAPATAQQQQAYAQSAPAQSHGGY